MTLATLVQLVKRQARHGDLNVTTDQISIDIVNYINLRARRIWRRWNWDWLMEEISISVAVGTIDYTLASTVGTILILTPDNGVGQLKRTTFKRYHQWQKDEDDSTGVPSRYMSIGRSSTKAIRIRIWPSPSAATTIRGWGKTKWTSYVVGDISTNTEIQFMPEEFLNVVLLGVLANVAESQGNKVEAQEKEQRFKNELDDMIPDEENKPDEELSSPPPDLYIFNKRGRSGTQVL